MTYLELCQRLRQELELPGTGPAAVTDQTGQLLSVVDWVQQAWIDIQNMKGGEWRWMRHGFEFDTTASDDTYGLADITDTTVSPNATIGSMERFNKWRLTDPWNPPRLKSSAGNDLGILTYWTWDRFVYTYKRGNVTSGQPTVITIDTQDQIVLGPTPDAVYTVEGEYFIGPQFLAENDDTPECPRQFHMAILYQAMIDYAFNDLAQERLAQAERRLPQILGPLKLNQGEHMRFRTAPPLA